jgi:hypothetical protein
VPLAGCSPGSRCAKTPPSPAVEQALELFSDDLLKHLLVQGEIRHQPTQPGVLLLAKFFHYEWSSFPEADQNIICQRFITSLSYYDFFCSYPWQALCINMNRIPAPEAGSKGQIHEMTIFYASNDHGSAMSRTLFNGFRVLSPCSFHEISVIASLIDKQ